MSETATANPPSAFPWTGLLRWQPFQIDALGLITLLGAEEVNAAVGRLVHSTWVEYLPLLGAYVIANDRFREKEAGYSIYNISKGIHTADISSWFSRWIRAQDFEQTRSFVRWTYERRPESWSRQELVAIVLSVTSIGFLIAMTVLSYDWYGFANAMAMASSVLVRHFMVNALRKFIDDGVEKTCKTKVKKYSSVKAVDNEKRSGMHPLEKGWPGDLQKIMIITTDARAVTMLIPSELIKPPSPFIANLRPHDPWLYTAMRFSGWVAFAVQVVTVGMSMLATQLITVFLLVVPTVLFVNKLGCDDSQLKPRLKTALWKVRRWLLSGAPSRGNASDLEDANRKQTECLDSEFKPKYVCWIGKYLKAEVYEWPRTHHYTIKDGKFRGLSRKKEDDIPEAGNKGDSKEEYSKEDDGKKPEKRQHLYAWLQLTVKETESMDKWDLFPHKRVAYHTADPWFQEYTLGKAGIADCIERGSQGITKLIPWTKDDHDDEAEANKKAHVPPVAATIENASKFRTASTGQEPTSTAALTTSFVSDDCHGAGPADPAQQQQQQQQQPARQDTYSSVTSSNSAMHVSQETRVRRLSAVPTTTILVDTVAPAATAAEGPMMDVGGTSGSPVAEAASCHGRQSD